MDLEATLEAVFRADHALRAAEAELLKTKDRAQLAQLLARRVETERMRKGAEACANLERLAALCSQAPSATTVDALIRILDYVEPEVRQCAGEALLDLGVDRYRELRAGVERALAAPGLGPALEELPFVLAELGDPPSVSLIARFLQVDSVDAIASGIEALTAVGDPTAIAHLKALENDTRTVTLHEEGVGELTVTLGELAREGISELTGEGG